MKKQRTQIFLSWLYTHHFSHFDMFVPYFVRLRTNHYTLSQYHRFHSALILRETCHIVLFNISWKYRSSGENGETPDEKNDWRDGSQNAILYTSCFSRFANIFSCSRQFDDRCTADFTLFAGKNHNWLERMPNKLMWQHCANTTS